MNLFKIQFWLGLVLAHNTLPEESTSILDQSWEFRFAAITAELSGSRPSIQKPIPSINTSANHKIEQEKVETPPLPKNDQGVIPNLTEVFKYPSRLPTFKYFESSMILNLTIDPSFTKWHKLRIGINGVLEVAYRGGYCVLLRKNVVQEASSLKKLNRFHVWQRIEPQLAENDLILLFAFAEDAQADADSFVNGPPKWSPLETDLKRYCEDFRSLLYVSLWQYSSRPFR